MNTGRYFRHVRVQVVLRVLGIVATAVGLDRLVAQTAFYEWWVILGVALAVQVALLVHYSEKIPRDVTRFLASIQDGDFSQRFTSGQRGAAFDELRTAFADAHAAFQSIQTERQKRSLHLEQVFNAVPLALITFTDDGTVAFANPALRRLLHVPHLRTVDQLAATSPALADAIRAADAPADAPMDVVVPVTRSGETLQVAVSTRRFRMDDATYGLATLRDIRQTLQAKEMEAWERLSRVLTHEIMNSIGPICSLAKSARRHANCPPRDADGDAVGARGDGIANGAGRRAADDRLCVAVRTIEERSTALEQFVTSFRSLTRVPDPQIEAIDVATLFARVERFLESYLRDGSLTLRTTVDPPDATLYVDPALVEQILINLLLNAVQAVDGMDDPTIELQATLNRYGRTTIEVRDNGPGIEADVQERIFVPFFSTKDDGSGIGLSLSRRIMHAHGGQLTVASVPGDGATFTLQF